jgi:ammonia channel protein AmtB
MTLPGFALFYGAPVRAENLLSVPMQCFTIACLVSVLWLVGAYSLTFSGSGPWLGAVLLWSVAGYVIVKVVQGVSGLRISADTEGQGIDLRTHGERGYNM